MSSEPSDRPHFLREPAETEDVERMYADDMAELGYVMNHTRLWSHHPPAVSGLFELMGEVNSIAGLSVRQRGVLVTAAASTLGDSYCSVSWGSKLAAVSDPATAEAVLVGEDSSLPEEDRVLAAWARKVAQSPHATTPDDLEKLRAAGFDDRAILGITAYIALRLAFSTVNNALGAHPDRPLWEAAPPEVVEAVDFGRRP